MVPAGIVALAGETRIELTTAGVTVTSVDPVIEPEVAEMLALPMALPLTKPSPLTATNATDGSSEFHKTEGKSWVLPSVNVAMAVSCTVVPRAIDGLPGSKAMETSAAGRAVNVVVPCTEP